MPIALLPPGEYVARAVVTVTGRKVGQVVRPFRVIRPARANTSAATTPAPAPTPPIAFASRIDAFDKSAVLTPQVLGVLPGSDERRGNRVRCRPPRSRAARAGDSTRRWTRCSRGDDQLAPVFLKGLELLSRGDLERAAGKFRDALRIDSEFFSAAFYLGACYAAGGRDRDAAGAWQTSLITERHAPFVYTLLGDALLRLRDMDQAIDILTEASLWPADEQVRSGSAPHGPAGSRRTRSGRSSPT